MLSLAVQPLGTWVLVGRIAVDAMIGHFHYWAMIGPLAQYKRALETARLWSHDSESIAPIRCHLVPKD